MKSLEEIAYEGWRNALSGWGEIPGWESLPDKDRARWCAAVDDLLPMPAMREVVQRLHELEAAVNGAWRDGKWESDFFRVPTEAGKALCEAAEE